MKRLFLSLVPLFLLSFRPAEDFYALPLKTIDGGAVNLNDYQGKKVLVVVLPLSGRDTAVRASELAELQARYPNLVVLGVPSIEEGFSQSGTQALKTLYQNAGANLTLTEGLRVKKGTGQHPLFQWLTHKDKNKHFDQESEGRGAKFFVDEGGELYAVIGPQVKLSHPVIDRVMTRPVH